MIKIVVVLFLISSVLSQKYSSKFDNINIDNVLNNKRVLNNYIRCILDEGPCTAEGREFRQHIPEAIETDCSKCTDTQKNIVRKTAKFMMKNHLDDWNRIAAKYDPDGKHKESFNNFVNGN